LPLKLAETAVQGSAFTSQPVRIFTRRPALAESIARHVTALGLSAICDSGDQGNSLLTGEGLLIVDLSTHATIAESALAGPCSARLIVIASAAETLRLGTYAIDPERIVSKPVHREALGTALKRAAGLATESSVESAKAQHTALGGHVLLVEDEPVNAAVAQGYLEELGCTSVWVDSGREAVARSATERFDLIMMDLNMPTMDGFATTRLIREREGNARRVPIIALTAHEANNYRTPCLAAGMDEVMSKPYTLDQCAELLRRWIEPRFEGALASVAQIDAHTVAGLKNLRSPGQGNLYSKLVGLFQPAAAKAIGELEAALAASDFETAAGICHRFASSAANVGALIFARHIRELEKLCRTHDGARAADAFETIRSAYPALNEELMRWQLKESA
jgi:CheY-like chemotaxis protein/HPt (histidine-containing phosphotransfer) domain-containing protein